MSALGSFRKGELEEEVPKPAASAAALPERIDRLERAYQAELTVGQGLNIRGTALAGASALAILLVAQFSAIWLDDSEWELSEGLDLLQRYVLLPGAVLALVLCLLAATLVLWPSRGWAADLKQRLAEIGESEDEAEARLLARILDGQRINNERKARILRVASIPLALSVICIVAQSMIFAFDAKTVDVFRTSKPGAALQRSLTGLPAPAVQQGLAEIYAPLVYLHSEERFGPAEPSAFIEASSLGWNEKRRPDQVEARGEVEPARLGEQCEGAPGDCYTHGPFLARELTRPFLKADERPAELQEREEQGFFLDLEDSARGGDLSDSPDVPVYYEFRPTREGVAITYWLYYAFSQPNTDALVRDFVGDAISHEGDWENIDVVLSADLTRPLGVFFYGHGHPQRREWTDVCKLVGETEDCRSARPGHPIVYSALGSHASYPLPGETKVCGKAGCACDVREPGRAWMTWDPVADVRLVWNEPWFGFGGAWGRAGKLGDLTGPLGPSPWKLPADPDPGDLEPVKPC